MEWAEAAGEGPKLREGCNSWQRRVLHWWRGSNLKPCPVASPRRPCLPAANVYLIDEPSANLDSEQRILAAKIIKRWVGVGAWVRASAPTLARCSQRQRLLRRRHRTVAAAAAGAAAAALTLQLLQLLLLLSPPLPLRLLLLSPPPLVAARPDDPSLAPFPVLQVHHAQQEDRLHCGARLHHGSLPCGPVSKHT